jgi:hypothetical protein
MGMSDAFFDDLEVEAALLGLDAEELVSAFDLADIGEGRSAGREVRT